MLEKLSKLNKKDVVLTSPLKFPMIVPPKEYNNKEVGGYLLNDVEYVEEMFTDKKQSKWGSELAPDNKLFYLLNKSGSTPFKVNKDFL